MTDRTLLWKFKHLPVWYRRLKASKGGWFFIPCPLCGTEFAGYEWRDCRSVMSLPCSVPDGLSRSRSKGICPECTANGLGWERRNTLVGAS